MGAWEILGLQGLGKEARSAHARIARPREMQGLLESRIDKGLLHLSRRGIQSYVICLVLREGNQCWEVTTWMDSSGLDIAGKEEWLGSPGCFNQKLKSSKALFGNNPVWRRTLSPLNTCFARTV